MMPVLIQGPKQPGNDIDVYLRSLVDEILLLWKEEGVRVTTAQNSHLGPLGGVVSLAMEQSEGEYCFLTVTGS